MNRLWTFIGVVISSLFLLGWSTAPDNTINADTPVWEMLMALGESAPNHVVNENVGGEVSATIGKNIVLGGYKTDRKVALVAPQSKHFKCTACHNVLKEDPDLSKSDPEARLDYALQNNLPFLQGTTLYGAVNRTSFYNDDYEKKYGSLVTPARNNLREAIQLCAVECSQGRLLKPNELESVLAYLWTIQLKVSDLNISPALISEVEQAMQEDWGETDKEALRQKIKSHYLAGSPAHFVDPPGDRKAGAPFTGRPERGKIIYELGCQHCHENERYSFYNLDDSKYSFRHLAKHIPKYSKFSLYQVARYGTSPIPGKRAYMPMYSIEKLSEQQLEDLRAYIEQQAK